MRNNLRHLTHLHQRLFKAKQPVIVSVLKHRTLNSVYPIKDQHKLPIIIPCAVKDIAVLPTVVASLRRFVTHEITKILIVSPDHPEIRSICAKHQLHWIDENSILPSHIQTLHYTPNGMDRSGWIKQQIIKFSGNILIREPQFLVVDADTVFLRDIAFWNKHKQLFYCSLEYHIPYAATYKKLLDLNKRFALSFVSHFMLFDVNLLQQLKKQIENHSAKPWYDAIVNSLDPKETSSFSEYDTYGNFCWFNFRKKFELRYSLNVPKSPDYLSSLDDLVRQYGDDYFTISFHDYLKKTSS